MDFKFFAKYVVLLIALAALVLLVIRRNCDPFVYVFMACLLIVNFINLFAGRKSIRQ